MKRLLTLVLTNFPLLVFAHPGHGSIDGNSLLHYFGTPEHSLPVAAVVLIIAIVLFRKAKRSTVS